MNPEQEKTAWMWLSGDALCGLSLDRETNSLTWIGQAGCHCSDGDAIVQGIAQYQQEGPPPFINLLPEEIAAEVRDALARACHTHEPTPAP